MRKSLRREFFQARLLPCLAAGWLLAGCASTPKVDWNSRIGNFTHDQAVAEMGPPDRSTKLSDDATVEEWFVRHKSTMAIGVGTGSYSGGSSVVCGQTIGRSPAYG